MRAMVLAALALTAGRGVDAVIDMVGSRDTVAAGLRALALGGRWVLIGSRPQDVLTGSRP